MVQKPPLFIKPPLKNQRKNRKSGKIAFFEKVVRGSLYISPFFVILDSYHTLVVKVVSSLSRFPAC